MQIDIVNIEGKKVGELALADAVFACTTTQGPALMTVAGRTVPSASKICVMPIFLPMMPVSMWFPQATCVPSRTP